jgi:putative pyruvate formate lyase activating enzyme
MMLKLQSQGCHNINFVTPTHYVPQILEALVIASDQGLTIPIVYNTSGYESLDTLKLLDGVVDIYLPDMRYADKAHAKKFSDAYDYPEINRAAIKEMHRQVGDLVLDNEGIAVKGLLIRHLVLPENISGTDRILEFIAKEISKNTYISLMSQYFPAFRAHDFAPLDRKITRKEYEKATAKMTELGLASGWTQTD